MDIPFLSELVSILALCVGVMYLCHRLGLPSIVGFLAAGIVAGPGGLGLVTSLHQVEMMAEVGVVLLLFTIGLELSASELVRLRRPVFIGGSVQIGLTILLCAGLAMAFGARPSHAVFLGFLGALSSTAIVLKELQTRAELESPHGRVDLSILIAQDLAVVPMMLLIPFLAGTGGEMGPALWSLLAKAAGVLGLLFVMTRYVVPRIFLAVARTRVRELFLLATIVFCLGVALLTGVVGLSLSLGAFMAGLMLSESEYAQNAMQGVMPFKDVFTSLFFVSMGMLVDVRFILAHPLGVMLVAVAIVVLKSGVAGVAGLALGYPLRTAILAGLALGQVGEFSFILAKSGLEGKLISQGDYQLFLAASVITMAVTPWIIQAGPRLAGLVCRKCGQAPPPATKVAALEGHLLIAGFGPGGKQIAQAARQADIPYTILEMNIDTVKREKLAGEPISYGDASYPGVLEHAGIHKARVMVVVVSDPAAVRRIVDTARKMNERLRIIVRTRFVGEATELLALGATEVVPEEFETSIEIFTRVLEEYLVPHQTIESFTEKARRGNYQMLRAPLLSSDGLDRLQPFMLDMDLSAFTVEPYSALDGKSLIETRLRKEHGLTLVAIGRGGDVVMNPDGASVLAAGDVAYVFGRQEVIAEKEWLFKTG